MAIQYLCYVCNPWHRLRYITRTVRYKIAILEVIEIFSFSIYNCPQLSAAALAAYHRCPHLQSTPLATTLETLPAPTVLCYSSYL